MRTFLWWLFVALACTPVTLMTFVAAEARYPGLDPLTLHNPSFLREFVGEVAITWVGYGKDSASRLDRVLRLAPNNAEAWTRRCSEQNYAGLDQAFAACTKAVSLSPMQWNYNNLGRAQEKRHDPCAAEDSFNVANMKAAWADTYILREFGEASLECGHVAAAVNEFEQAEKKDAQQVAVAAAENEDEDDLQEEKDDLATDRDWLILVYGRYGSMTEAAQMCSTVHPAWKTCSCNIGAKGVQCADHPTQPRTDSQIRAPHPVRLSPFD